LTQNLQEPQIAAAKSALGEKGGSREKQDRLITAYNFVCPTMYLAQRVRDRGGRSWLYYFSRQREGEQAARMGAYHGAELPYVFDTHDDWLPTNDLDRRLTDTIMSYWVNFARSGEPNAKQLTTWPLFDRLSARVLRLDTQINSQVHESLALCDVLLPPA
jgi:para-nitrobenzyl esterase